MTTEDAAARKRRLSITHSAGVRPRTRRRGFGMPIGPAALCALTVIGSCGSTCVMLPRCCSSISCTSTSREAPDVHPGLRTVVKSLRGGLRLAGELALHQLVDLHAHFGVAAEPGAGL